MAQLLDELLKLSRVGRMMNPPEDVSLSVLAREAASLVSRPASLRADGEAAVEFAIDSDLPVVRGDRIRLFQVFQNLIENAIKFRSEDQPPRIEIGCQQ